MCPEAEVGRGRASSAGRSNQSRHQVHDPTVKNISTSLIRLFGSIQESEPTLKMSRCRTRGTGTLKIGILTMSPAVAPCTAHPDTSKEEIQRNASVQDGNGKRGIQQTCQLVSVGSPVICMRYGVRRGRGALRSWVGPKPSRWREPRANWTVKRSPIKSDPSCRHISQDTTGRIEIRKGGGQGWSMTYGKLQCTVQVSHRGLCFRRMSLQRATMNIPGTTSRASMASLYSMKPKPFISLISVISPVPWVAKWASTSCLVATARI